MSNVQLNEIQNGINSSEQTLHQQAKGVKQQQVSDSIWAILNQRFNQSLAWLAGLSVMLMMLLIVSNSIIRVFADPFSGTTEVVGWLMAIATSFSIGYTQLRKGHVDIDLLVNRFPPIVRKILQAAIQLVSLLFFSIVGYQIIKYGLSLMENGTLSQTMGIIFYPFVFVVSLGFFGTSSTLAVQFIETLKRGDRNGA